jgi:biotin synthase
LPAPVSPRINTLIFLDAARFANSKIRSIPGTPLGEVEPLAPLELVRTIAVARILMPQATLRLSAGRRSLSDEAQALCFHAGANSIFYGDRLLTTGNPDHEKDLALFERLGLQAMG